MRDLEFKLFGHRVLYLLDTRVAEFNEFSALCTDQVVVLLAFVCALEVRHIFTELMLDNQATIE